MNAHTEEKFSGLGMVHFILSHSYLFFLLAVIVGAFFHIAYPIQIFSGLIYPYAGFCLIIAGSALIYWAQTTSNKTKKTRAHPMERDFERGPYKYSRNPTHIGLTIMTLGLAMILNSFFTVLFIILASLISKFYFLKKEEALLAKRYGQAYLDYKKKVSTWV